MRPASSRSPFSSIPATDVARNALPTRSAGGRTPDHGPDHLRAVRPDLDGQCLPAAARMEGFAIAHPVLEWTVLRRAVDQQRPAGARQAGVRRDRPLALAPSA